VSGSRQFEVQAGPLKRSYPAESAHHLANFPRRRFAVRKSKDDNKKIRRRGKKQPQEIFPLPEGDGISSTATTCSAFQCSRPTLYRWIKLGIFPAPSKLGGMAVWDLATLREVRAKIFGGAK
jgi:hypothetical protein